ncbi:MAG: hypothetical protein E7490_07940 [Ruminococcaceae bacterium]|nr:hypothetical protein [Oscillospiraceae bacterium]
MNENEIILNEEEQATLPVPAKSRKKIILIILASVTALILLGILFWFQVLSPRIELSNYIKENLTDISSNATYYDKHSVTYTCDTKEITNGHIIMELPSDFNKQKEVNVSNGPTVVYGPEINKTFYKKDGSAVEFNTGDNIIVMFPDEWGDTMNLIKNHNNIEYLPTTSKISKAQLKRGFEILGYGLPDSSFNTFKCAFLLEGKDYGFWNFEANLAYTTIALIRDKAIGYYRDKCIIFENDEVCGFIGVQQADEENVGFIEYESTAGYTKRYFVLVEIYDKNDLNTSTSMLLEVDDLDIVYSLINSARPAK